MDFDINRDVESMYSLKQVTQDNLRQSYLSKNFTLLSPILLINKIINYRKFILSIFLIYQSKSPLYLKSLKRLEILS